MTESAHAWWSRLRHQGLLLSPVVMVERYPDAPSTAPFHVKNRLRDAYTRFVSTADSTRNGAERDQAAVLGFVDALLENFVGHSSARLAKQHSIPDKLTVAVRIGSRSEAIRPHRILFADDAGATPALFVMADTSPQVGRGRGRNAYARFLELLRGTGHRLGLLTNGQQFRLVYAGLDFESWCEWENERWFDGGEGTEELLGLRQLLSPESLHPVKQGISGLLDAVEESRKRQADLSSVLRENVRQAVELLLEEVSTANRTISNLFTPLVQHGDRKLTDAEAHEALLQATVRVVMRLVVCLFAESRQLLPVNDPIYAQSYGVRSLYELLDEAARHEGGTHVLFNRQTAWPRLMALFRLVHGGSAHGAFPLRPYGGVLFRPGDQTSDDAVARALHILEHNVTVGDATIYHVLRKLLRGPLPVLRGRAKTFVEGPVDYTDLRTEFIGLIYEGLLDYRLKRTDEQIGPQVFLNLGREPVLPLSRLIDMLTNDKKGLKDLLTTLRKEKVSATVSEDTDESEEESEEQDQTEDETAEEESVEVEAEADEIERKGDYLDAVEAAKSWAKEAVMLAGIVPKQKKRQTDAEYQTVIEAEANRLIKRVVATGEFYLVRAGNTRKGTGTFYTRPQLAVPTTHRTLEPLCYDKAEDGTLLTKTPEEILYLKVCDPACGSASFLVAALHYLTGAIYKSLCHHRRLDDPAQSKKITLPFGRPRTNTETDQLVPFSPDDPQRGHTFEERIKALLRRHVVERCIYRVDINPLAVELARVSLWVETLDPELPFSFLDHKIKVGNSLVGCWLDWVEDYPLKAWEREGGDGEKGQETELIAEFLKGEKLGNQRTGDGVVKRELREVIDAQSGTRKLFGETVRTVASVVEQARRDYEALHAMPIHEPDVEEDLYRRHVAGSETAQALRRAMDEWCAIWYWPLDAVRRKVVPMPLSFLSGSQDSIATVAATADQIRFFHWELEFPDVFTPERTGFDAVVGNPPWDVMKPNSQEFFSDYDPLYRMYDKQAALRRQQQLFAADPAIERRWLDYNALFRAFANWAGNVAEPFDVTLARGKEGARLKATWEARRKNRLGYTAVEHPFRLQGSADLNSYKMFAEVFWHILRPGGRLGAILPTGLYSDFGTRGLRDELLFRGQLELIYAFQNEKRVFSAAHHSFKQAAVFATKGGSTREFRARFRMGVGDSPESHEIPNDILGQNGGQAFTPDNVRANSPKTISLVELRTPCDVAIFEKIYANSIRIGDNAPGWEITYATEFHMTNDSKQFSPREKWEANGYRNDVFDRWIGPAGEVAVPVYEGRMIGQLDFSEKGWVGGKGRSAIWREIAFDGKTLEPQLLMSEATFRGTVGINTAMKTGFMDVTSATNSRTFVSSVIVGLPCGNKVPTLTLKSSSSLPYFFLAACGNSLSFDYAARKRLTGTTLNWFIIEELPLPRAYAETAQFRRASAASAFLTLIHRRFAPEWLKLTHELPVVFAFDPFAPATDDRSPSTQWKHWWAVTEADRLRLKWTPKTGQWPKV